MERLHQPIPYLNRGEEIRVRISAEEILKLAKSIAAPDALTKELILSEKIKTHLYPEEKEKSITGVLVGHICHCEWE